MTPDEITQTVASIRRRYEGGARPCGCYTDVQTLLRCVDGLVNTNAELRATVDTLRKVRDDLLRLIENAAKT